MKYPQPVSMPSAISDWLEEQLEARGIDAVLYTRYILSLLHSDTIDVIYSDEEPQFSHLKKGVKRSGGSSKRIRRSSDWWRHAQADADKLKRLAAVECLMSVSEQSFGIESLIDELCDKLNNSNVQPIDDTNQKPPNQLELQRATASPQELANRYYAAFPALNPHIKPTNLLALIPKWIPSPTKKKLHCKKPTAKKPANISSKNRKSDTMKATRQVGKQRFDAYFTGRTNAANMKKESTRVGKKQPEPTVWSLEPNDDELMLYDDLPVDLKELLRDDDDCFINKHSYNIELLNFANKRDHKSDFIPFGASINTIWSVGCDNELNSALDRQFSSISIDQQNEWNHILNEQSNELKRSWNANKWSEESGDDAQSSQIAISLLKLNHNRDLSPFAEIAPKNRTATAGSAVAPFSKVVGNAVRPPYSAEVKEDLLTSLNSHFRPIADKVEAYASAQYADGATFTVASAWDSIHFKRTESGAMYAESDVGKERKYAEYKIGARLDFVLKFLVCQNDVGVQTADETDAEVEATMRRHVRSQERRSKMRQKAEAARRQAEAAQKVDTNGNVWNSDGFSQFCADPKWDANLRGIWSDEKEEQSPTTVAQNTKLREDVMHDGNQLLSDLSLVQKSYMTVDFDEERPVSEFSFDLTGFGQPKSELIFDLMDFARPKSELIFDLTDFGQPKSAKCHQSLITSSAEEIWTFASRLEEDCLMAAIPTLRSVTL